MGEKGLQDRLVKREMLATLLFERLDEVTDYTLARKLADLVLDRLYDKK